ncbi:hypothetical protein R1sor_017937 [Riccia sorocarpa]|uniref:SWIM-type domain-containing protein n=1 Tax=Riccia sorocarpa TaxID=122646 RepID=A0ABD3I890_9MARC
MVLLVAVPGRNPGAPLVLLKLPLVLLKLQQQNRDPLMISPDEDELLMLLTGDGNVLKLRPRVLVAKKRVISQLQKAGWLSKVLANRVAINPNIVIDDLLKELRTTYNRNSSYFQMWRCRELVRDKLRGSVESSFHYIPSFCRKVQQLDPGCVVEWSTWDDATQLFRQAFISPSASRNVLSFTQKVIALDACHTKNHKYPAQLFLAMVLDGNNQALILAFALAPEEFDHIMQSLERSGGKGEELANYLKSIAPERFSRAMFPLPRFGKVTSNVAESINMAIKPIRHNAAFKVLHDLWFYVMECYSKRRAALSSMPGPLTPFAKERYEENRLGSQRFVCSVSSPTQASVRSPSGNNYVVKRQLDGTRGECTCIEFQEMLWPCSHCVSWDKECGNDSLPHFHPLWQVSSLEALYSTNFLPAFALEDLTPVFGCKAPPIAVKRGRHRIVRIPNGGPTGTCTDRPDSDPMEDGAIDLEFPMADAPSQTQPFPSAASTQGGSSSHSTLSVRLRGRGTRGGRTSSQTPRGTRGVQCGLCKRTGHNRRTCPETHSINRGCDMQAEEPQNSEAEGEFLEPIATQDENRTTEFQFEAGSDTENSDGPD